ncbi:MAG: cytidylate kinase-like family protein [Chloroflexota bacterium]|nr:MAG: cytidylate kinase-like family protein [Chloroflexota bacterium]
MAQPVVVTITSQVGAGAEQVAASVAERLSVPLLDREILSRAAARAGVSEETIEEAERVPSFLSRMVELLGRFPASPELEFPAPNVPAVPTMTVDAYRHLMEDVVRRVADGPGGAIVVGHAGQVMLRDVPGVLHIFIGAPADRRVRWLAEHQRLDLPAAEKQLKEIGRQRASFYQTYYKVNWTDHHLYDLMINMRQITPELAADLIMETVRRT